MRDRETGSALSVEMTAKFGGPKGTGLFRFPQLAAEMAVENIPILKLAASSGTGKTGKSGSFKVSA